MARCQSREVVPCTRRRQRRAVLVSFHKLIRLHAFAAASDERGVLHCALRRRVWSSQVRPGVLSRAATQPGSAQRPARPPCKPRAPSRHCVAARGTGQSLLLPTVAVCAATTNAMHESILTLYVARSNHDACPPRRALDRAWNCPGAAFAKH